MRRARQDSPAEAQSGFTLIELIVVLVLIGLLASIAVQRMSHSRVQAITATMRADLRNFSLAQESHFYDNGIYSSSVNSVAGGEFRSSAGVTITVNEATRTGWSATAEHTATEIECYIYSGNAAPLGGASEGDQIDCS